MLLRSSDLDREAVWRNSTPDAPLADVRSREFARLDEAGHAYLDYTGAALYSASLVDACHQRLLGDILGNPHSENPASADTTRRMASARARVLAFFHAESDAYEVVFTANASAALRIVGESFPFTRGSRLILTADNHNSVNGIRCFASRAGAQTRYVPLDARLRADPIGWLQEPPGRRPSLFAFPGQSNFSGVRHPLHWIPWAHDRGYRVLLDAAALVPTSPLRLDRVHPDFVSVSFYKMFGFPTGIGALIARRDALAMLQRPWFAGGTIEWVSTLDDTHKLRPGGAAFEDGTPDFLAFDAVVDGLEWLERLGMQNVAVHVETMTRRLLDRLLGLRHANGNRIVAIHGPTSMKSRGGTIAFSVLDAAGMTVRYDHVVERLGRELVSVRGGCFCNPGCAETALALSAARTHACRQSLGAEYTERAFTACTGGATGAVRASVGIPTSSSDIERLAEALAACAHEGTGMVSGLAS
jgi:selenocysteine lyase/cysteine desulfurase